ncbi:NYN domain-containing protein [Mobilicoccus caccae]|uniref:NYN domain-containing protein n=1 Tax=Mobilicoccus caccae TaxID=1859295 RepID=A0ABQ6IQN5_9MICO|nr:NYN domain-containing protein [Mobilicoccus caccae]GMA40235.1 hypothetical protein GCM10025883_22800 [Mobilicoccus caccae]
MRSCCAVYVDVGYFLAAAATRVTGSSLRRGVQADYAALIAWLGEHAEADSGLPLLRVNWYDAGGRPGGMPDSSQDEIGRLPKVKLRLGRLSYSGEQKGVDVRIGLDLAIQARQRVADVVYLVSGDDDLTEAVEDAQSHGVQVVLLAVPRHDEEPLAVSKHLQREVDRTMVIDQAAIDAAVKPTAIPEALIPAPPGDSEPSEEDADGAERSATDAERSATDTRDPEQEPAEVATGQGGAPLPGPPRQRRRTVRVVSETPDAEHASAEATQQPSAQGADAADHRQAQEATQTESPAPTPAAEEDSRASSVPTPAMFAQRKAAGVALPESAADIPTPAQEGVTLHVIDAVAHKVVAAWCSSATPEALSALKNAAPIIPSELDRALLVDLAAHSEEGDLDDETRHRLRRQFWHHIGRVRPV